VLGETFDMDRFLARLRADDPRRRSAMLCSTSTPLQASGNL